MPPAMASADDEEESLPFGGRTRAGMAFTDDHLERRFQSTAANEGELMDEAAVKRMMAAQREADRHRPREASRSRSSDAPRKRRQSSSSESEQPQSRRRFGGEAAASIAPKSPPHAAASSGHAAGQGESRQPPATLCVGCVARLTGLKGAAHLNGEIGRLDCFDEAAGRWEVTLAGGDAKAIKPDNLLFEAPFATRPSLFSPPPPANVAPLSPPQQATGAGIGEIGGLSSAALAGGPPKVAPAAPAKPAHKTSRRMGAIRWYNGRRKMGCLIPDGGGGDLFIPAQGAPNGSMVPPQPGGLFHGTRVSFAPMAIKKEDSNSMSGTLVGGKADVVCMDVRPLPGQVGLSCGVETTAGKKDNNQDRLAALDLHELGFFAGIFDGHRGHVCAEHVAKMLPKAILEHYRARVKREPGHLAKCSHEKEAAIIAECIKEAFEATDKAFLVTARKKGLHDGSTAIIALVSHGYEVPIVESTGISGCAALWPKPKEPQEQPKEQRKPGTVPGALGGVAKLFMAWAGDCRGVLCRGRQGIRVSEDHRPNRPDEAKRVKDAGGVVLKDRGGTWRVGPRADNKFARELDKNKKEADKMKWYLATSRAFGDQELKAPDPIVIAKPDIRVVDLYPEDWALVICSDGVFDVLSDQNVADVMLKSMGEPGGNPVKAAKDVVAEALHRGSRDNLTAVVMRFGWSAPPSADSATGETHAQDADDNMFG